MAAAAAAPTIGQRLDTLLAALSNIGDMNHILSNYQPSTSQIYSLVIVLSVAFSFRLLNSGDDLGSKLSSSTVEQAKRGEKGTSSKYAKANNKNTKQSYDFPQPKWHILKLTNYVVTTLFLLSIITFLSNASVYLNDNTALMTFLGVWSGLLCYFFGFFGISFVELDDLVVTDADGQQRQQGVVSQPQKQASCKSRKVER